MAVNTRKWKLVGYIWQGPCRGSIEIDGNEVFEGFFEAQFDEFGDYIALGEYTFDDEYDTKHSAVVRLSEGVLLVGAFKWNMAHKTNPDLDADEQQYIFDVLNAPQSIIDSVTAKGGWSVRDPEFYTKFPGRNTIYSGDVSLQGLDTRIKLEIDGEIPDADAMDSGLVTLPVGSEMSFEFGIQGDKSGTNRP